ncbi:MAG: acetyl-CoA decarbonylase/synthase complex subunit gamma [Methanospirillaceae archaeon]|nr:acetyl-CoA decarbonylase/synthase complex subunit gamma [Methanospirillaceae archaeon]
MDGKQERKKTIKEISPIDVYALLPGTNCTECGDPNCMAFATRVVNGETTLDACPPVHDPEYAESYTKLSELLAPPVRKVVFGPPGHEAGIGGEHVLYRHEFTYQCPTVIAIDISDDSPPEEIEERVRKISGFTCTYIGRELTLDAIAVRSVSGEPARFADAIRTITRISHLPLILCSPDPVVMAEGLSAASGLRPLIASADSRNWKEMADLALSFSSPLVVSAPGDMVLLRSLARTCLEYGIKDIVLDPGTFPGTGLQETIYHFSAIRRSACKDMDQIFGLPILGTPISVWTGIELSPDINRWNEACLAAMLLTRYADLLIMHSIEGWVLLLELIWRFGIYTDPRRPVSVDPGLRVFGEPGPESPVFITSNYALTFFTVESDIKSARIDGYLIVIDTSGLSVESAVAGRYLTADRIAEAVQESEIESRVSHRYLIIPGLAARISGETEDASGWQVLVGPRDSSGIGKMIKEHWPPKDNED